MLKKINNFNYNCYLYYLNYRINKIKTIKDITYIIKNISFFYKNVTSDIIIDILSESLKIYPLKEKTMNIISILQQNYELSNGMEDYCCIMLWLAIIYSINNNSLLLL